MKEQYKEFEVKMQKAVSFLLEEFATIRAGRANAAVLDKVTVEYYGVQTPIQQIGIPSLFRSLECW